jgi:hypothetical protein
MDSVIISPFDTVCTAERELLGRKRVQRIMRVMKFENIL